jgi:hypothetical protein
LEKLTSDGYSILIFPEGTRSEDCSIGRFHKGAFYLAEKLNLDIIPIITHGVGHIFPKKEFLLRKGRVDILIGERITPNHVLRKNKDMLTVAKDMRTFYKEQYNILVSQIETTAYFKDRVYHNYIYKGVSIARKAKENLKCYMDYQSVISDLPDSGNILIINCGQGEFSLMTALVKKNLSITATETDKNLLSIAKNCISIPNNLSYVEDVENMEKYDLVVNADN